MDEEQEKFASEAIRMAASLRQFSSVKYAEWTPAQVVDALERIEVAAATLLQVFAELDLEHHDGQDLEREPYNWPVAQSLDMGLHLQEWMDFGGARLSAPDAEAFPTRIIIGVRALRNAAKRAAATERPKSGNSGRRTFQSALTDSLGKNFVRLFESRFDKLPPISKTGWVVDLMQHALVEVGLEKLDAGQVLRRAVETRRTQRKASE